MYIPKNSYIGGYHTSHGTRGTFSPPTKKASVLEADHRYVIHTPEPPPLPSSIDIMREYYDWIPMSFFLY